MHSGYGWCIWGGSPTSILARFRFCIRNIWLLIFANFGGIKGVVSEFKNPFSVSAGPKNVSEYINQSRSCQYCIETWPQSNSIHPIRSKRFRDTPDVVIKSEVSQQQSVAFFPHFLQQSVGFSSLTFQQKHFLSSLQVTLCRISVKIYSTQFTRSVSQ